jgi:hypothetical protein
MSKFACDLYDLHTAKMAKRAPLSEFSKRSAFGINPFSSIVTPEDPLDHPFVSPLYSASLSHEPVCIPSWGGGGCWSGGCQPSDFGNNTKVNVAPP